MIRIAANPVLISRPPARAAGAPTDPRDRAYHAVADRFAAMLAERDVATRIIDYPEQHKSATYAAVHGLGLGEHLHLIFRGSEDIRPIRGAYNVAWFAWSFAMLKSDGAADELILHDQVRMLRACDEVWVGSVHGQSVLKRHGVDRVFVVPAPVAVPDPLPPIRAAGLGPVELVEAVPLVSRSVGDAAAFARIADRFAQRLGTHARVERALAAGRVFLAVADPADPRENLATLIEGFAMAAADRDDAVLLVRLIGAAADTGPADYLYGQIRPLFGEPHALHEEGVILFAADLPDEDTRLMLGGIDYFLSAPLGRGQNLALLDAMAHGCVPVAVRNTAMRDYIDAEDAVIVAESRYTGLFARISPEIAQMRLETSFADRHQIADAVARALALDPAARAARSEAARARVAARYAADKVFAALVARLASARPHLAPPAMSAAQPATVPAGATGPRWWR